MPITVTCPSCHLTHAVPDASAGRRLECPRCGASAEIPRADENPYAPPSASLEPGVEGGFLPAAVPGTLLGKFGFAIKLFVGNLPLVSLIVLTVWLPGNLLLAAIALNAPEGDPRVQFQLNNLFDGIFGPIWTGGLIHALAKRMRGESAPYGEAISVGLRNWRRLFWVRFAAGIRVVVGMIALIVPGLILQVRYSLLDPVVILEGAGAERARRRSTRLTEGRRWQVVGAGILFFVPYLMLVFGVDFVVGEYDWSNNIAVHISWCCFIDVISAFLTVLMFVFYWEARDQEEPEGPEVGFRMSPA